MNEAVPRRDDLSSGRWELLQAAIRAGNTEEVASLLDAGFDICYQTGFGETVLSQAVVYGQAAIVTMLLARGADIEESLRKGGTPLLLAAGRGHVDVVRLLLAKGADPDRRDDFGNSPLLDAARNLSTEALNTRNPERWRYDQNRRPTGYAAVVECLILAGADVTWRPRKNSYPPYHFIRQAGIALLTGLLEGRAPPERVPSFWRALFGIH